MKKDKSTGAKMMKWRPVYVGTVGEMLMSRVCPQGSPLALRQLDKVDPSALAKFPANSSEQLA